MTATRDPAGRREGQAARSRPGLRRHAAVAGKAPVYQITSARRGVRDDVAGRTRRYLISMGVRTACVLGAVVAGGWLRWVLLVGAVALPYLAVVIANGGRERIEDTPLFHDQDVPAITGPDR